MLYCYGVMSHLLEVKYRASHILVISSYPKSMPLILFLIVASVNVDVCPGDQG
jgi:hypothetical protein